MSQIIMSFPLKWGRQKNIGTPFRSGKTKLGFKACLSEKKYITKGGINERSDQSSF